MWKNVVELGRPQMTIWRMFIACWIPKATNTDSEYAIIIAFPLKQWLQERAAMLRYTYIACLVLYYPGIYKSTRKVPQKIAFRTTCLQADNLTPGCLGNEALLITTNSGRFGDVTGLRRRMVRRTFLFVFAGCCESGNERSGSIKRGKFLD
jgi:hypothetical protein